MKEIYPAVVIMDTPGDTDNGCFSYFPMGPDSYLVLAEWDRDADIDGTIVSATKQEAIDEITKKIDVDGWKITLVMPEGRDLILNQKHYDAFVKWVGAPD